jgi:hypothetical protein
MKLSLCEQPVRREVLSDVRRNTKMLETAACISQKVNREASSPTGS